MPSFSRALLYLWKREISESLIPTGGRRVGDLLLSSHAVFVSAHSILLRVTCLEDVDLRPRLRKATETREIKTWDNKKRQYEGSGI